MSVQMSKLELRSALLSLNSHNNSDTTGTKIKIIKYSTKASISFFINNDRNLNTTQEPVASWRGLTDILT